MADSPVTLELPVDVMRVVGGWTRLSTRSASTLAPYVDSSGSA